MNAVAHINSDHTVTEVERSSVLALLQGMEQTEAPEVPGRLSDTSQIAGGSQSYGANRNIGSADKVCSSKAKEVGNPVGDLDPRAELG